MCAYVFVYVCGGSSSKGVGEEDEKSVPEKCFSCRLPRGGGWREPVCPGESLGGNGCCTHNSLQNIVWLGKGEQWKEMDGTVLSRAFQKISGFIGWRRRLRRISPRLWVGGYGFFFSRLLFLFAILFSMYLSILSARSSPVATSVGGESRMNIVASLVLCELKKNLDKSNSTVSFLFSWILFLTPSNLIHSFSRGTMDGSRMTIIHTSELGGRSITSSSSSRCACGDHAVASHPES